MSKMSLSDQVSESRWKEAQKWESNHWVGAQRARAKFGKNFVWRILSAFGLVSRYRGDDDNQWWKEQFKNYEFLPETMRNVIEVGCGPYTNVRTMLDRCHFNHLYLSDPLIRTYTTFKLTFVADMYAQAACVLDDHPIEDLPFASDYFDLVVMINVLDHVKDARRCMDTVVRITKPGGYLIIGQELTSEEDLVKIAGNPGQVGHPITVDGKWFDPWLDKGFEPVIRKVLSRTEGRSTEFHYGTLVFAGKKM